MPRINTYPPDVVLQNEDLILGSDYKGTVNGIPIYETKSFSLNSLGNYLSRFVYADPNIYDLARYDSLASYAGEYDENGNLISLSTAFADQILSVTTSERYANALFATNLAASVGLYDENGLLIQLSEAFANQVLTVTTTDRFATSEFTTNLAASFGTYDENGNILSYSNATFLDSMKVYVDENSATASKVEAMNSTLQILDENGNAILTNAGYLEAITTHVDTNSASAKIARGLNAEFGITDADGNTVKTRAQFDEEVTTYVDANAASAKIARGLNTEFGITDADGNIVKTKAEFDEEVSQYVDANSATANIATKLNTEFGIVDPVTGETVKTKAQFDEEVSQYVDANSATANIATKLNTEFGIVDPVTGETVKTGAQYLDEVTQHVDSNSATASKVTNLNSTLDILNADGTVKKNSAQFLQDITTHVDENSATAGLVEALEVTVGNIPLIYRQDDPPSLTETPIGSLWFDTNDNNKGHILVAGDPNVWTLVEDTEFTQFKSTYEQVINNTATESSATATKTTRLNAVLEILDENGNLIPQSQSEYFDTITNYVDTNSATAEKAESLRVAIEGADGTGGISAELNETSIAVASKPNVYRQDAPAPVAPEGETIPLKSVWYDTADNNKPYIYDGNPAAWVEARDGKVTELESYALAQKTIEADANGVVTGITVKSENSGDPATAISDITFKTNTFNIVDQNDTVRLAFDQTGLFINGSGNFTGDITGASGTFGGSLNVNGNFLVNTAGSVQIKGGDTLGDARFEILDDSGNSKYRLYGGGINLNSWAGDNALSGGQIQFGGVAHMYSGNGTTVTSNHHMTLDVYGGSKKLFLKADQITLRKSTTTGGSHTTIIEGDLEVQGNVSFTSSSSHPDTSSVSDSNNTGQTFIQNLVFDSYGHVTSFTSGTVSTDTPAIYADGSGNPQLTTGVTAAEVRALIGAGTSSFSGDYADLSNKPALGTAAFANTGDFATAGHNHTYDVNNSWLRDNGDNANVKLYGNTRQMAFRTDGTTEYASGVGGYPFAWMYGGDAASNRRMLLGSDGNLWTSAYGWLHTAFASAGHLHDTRYLRKDTNSSSSGTITAQDFILSSDQRLKSDINTYTVKPINIKYRDYVINSNRDRRRVGVLAQELEESHPEFVTTNPDTGYKAVSYIDMLVAKVAELEERIKQLENGGA